MARKAKPATAVPSASVGALVLEKSLEMAGIVVFIHALLSYLSAQVGEVRIRFGD